MSVEGVVAIAAVAIVPLVALMLSAFVKTSVVLALLRNALGAPQAPPGLVVTGLALLITVFAMAPVGQQVLDAVAPVAGPGPGTAPGGGAGVVPGGGAGVVPGGGAGVAPDGGAGVAPGGAGGAAGATDAGAPTPGATGADGVAAAPAAGGPVVGVSPGGAGAVPVDPLAGRALPTDAAGWTTAVLRASVPVRAFLLRHAHPEDRAAFVGLARELRGADVADDDLLALAAAFVTSELTEAFAIAFLVFLPFLVLDLIVGIGLAAAGLTTVSPVAVALPLKLVLFVAVDGWRLLVEGLIRGYA